MTDNKNGARYLILGAAGRDFHNFNVLFRDAKTIHTVVGFTATQIPSIDGRKYPPELSGPKYPDGLPIWIEDDLEKLIKEHRVTRCMLAYSDLQYDKVMQLAARCLKAGADFELVAPVKTEVASCRPVIAITAVRTGCGKSQVTRYIVDVLKKMGKKAVVIRHPMPYGNLAKQAVQRFAKYEDLEKHEVTIEEREEYEQHIKEGTVVYAGVDYESILRQAEQEADVVLWDGGNNDVPFYKPDLWLVVTDPLRVGHESLYYPGEVNFRGADIIIINKANTAPAKAVQKLRENAALLNPSAEVVVTNSEVTVDRPELVKGKRVVCVEDGPTLTHGEMEYGAGMVAAKRYGAAEVVDPRPYFKGSMKDTHDKYPKLGNIVPAMGYYPSQVRDLEATINAVPCDTVVIGTPLDLRKVVQVDKPATVVSYEITDRDTEEGPLLSSLLTKRLKSMGLESEANGHA